jgi:hypothetical protein
MWRVSPSNLRERLYQFLGLQEINERLIALHERVVGLAPPPPLKPPGPFVAVLVLAENARGGLVTMGRGHELAGATDAASIGLNAQLPLRNVQLIVFCDLSRVNVEGIFRGPDLMHANLGECPIAKFEEWPLGQRVHVNVRVRR